MGGGVLHSYTVCITPNSASCEELLLCILVCALRYRYSPECTQVPILA